MYDEYQITLTFDRNPSNWSFDNVPENFLFDRGYTGHEHIDEFGLINMNGRVYDAYLARFLSPDPFVQAPDYSQNYNRYSYVLNNPLKYTDPDGYETRNYWEYMRDMYGQSSRGDYATLSSNRGAPGGGLGAASSSNLFGGFNREFNNTGYSYDELRDLYENDYGQIVSYDEVFDNMISPNAKTVSCLLFVGTVQNPYEIFRGAYFSDGTSWNALTETTTGRVIGEAGGGLDDRFSNSEKATLGLAATGGSVQVTTELINRLSGTVKNADVVNFGKSVTKKFGFVGVGLTTYNAFSDGTFTTGDGARILLSGATFIPYVGWAYGAVDIGVLMVTGTSVTDRVGIFVDEHWGPGPIRP